MQRKKIENHCVRYSSLLVIAPKVNISLYISKRHVFMNSKKKNLQMNLVILELLVQ